MSIALAEMRDCRQAAAHTVSSKTVVVAHKDNGAERRSHSTTDVTGREWMNVWWARHSPRVWGEATYHTQEARRSR